jgi:hypothetical protein
MSIRRFCDMCGDRAGGEITINAVRYHPDAYEPHGLHFDLCEHHFGLFLQEPIHSFLKESHIKGDKK